MRKSVVKVKNAAGDTLLTLDGEVKQTAFSPDWTWFACLKDHQLCVYDTATWTEQCQHLVTVDSVNALHLLQDSTYIIVSHGGE